MTASWQIGSAQAQYSPFGDVTGRQYVSRPPDGATSFYGTLPSRRPLGVSSLSSSRRFGSVTTGEAKTMLQNLSTGSLEDGAGRWATGGGASPYGQGAGRWAATTTGGLPARYGAHVSPLGPVTAVSIRTARAAELEAALAAAPPPAALTPPPALATPPVADHRFRLPSTAEIRACVETTDAQRGTHERVFGAPTTATGGHVYVSCGGGTLPRAHSFHGPLTSPTAAYKKPVASYDGEPPCWSNSGDYTVPKPTGVATQTYQMGPNRPGNVPEGGDVYSRPMYWLYGSRGAPYTAGDPLYARASVAAQPAQTTLTSGGRAPLFERARTFDGVTSGAPTSEPARQYGDIRDGRVTGERETYVSTVHVTPRDNGYASTLSNGRAGARDARDARDAPATSAYGGCATNAGNASQCKSILKKNTGLSSPATTKTCNRVANFPFASMSNLIRRSSSKRVTFRV